MRYSQLAPSSMFEEKNPRNNMPAQVEIYAEGQDNESAYKFLFIAKGGGSANKSFLFQATPSILTHDRMLAFLKAKVLTLGTAACPPYHLAIVIGGTSVEMTMKTVKLASAHYLDELPTKGSEDGHAFRDLAMEKEVLAMTQSTGVGAQFGGKYFCHDVRVIRLPRHGASLPIGLGVSCAADRQALGKITRDGVFLEELEHHPAQYLPDIDQEKLGGAVVKVDLRRPMKEIVATLSKYLRWRISGRTRASSGAISARHRSGETGRRGGQGRFAAADEGDSGDAVEISGEDAALALRAVDRGARPGARQVARAVGSRQRPAGLFQKSPDLLRRARENAGRLRLRSLRADHGGTDGFLHRSVPGRRRFYDFSGEGKSFGAGARRLP